MPSYSNPVAGAANDGEVSPEQVGREGNPFIYDLNYESSPEGDQESLPELEEVIHGEEISSVEVMNKVL